MSTAFRVNRKINDEDLRMYNNLGLSLRAIGEKLDCHPTTVKGRLELLGVAPSDTRRSFTEELYKSLSPSSQRWIEQQIVETGVSIKDLLAHLITGASTQTQTTQD